MAKWKILIVDDEPGFTEMVKLNLEATGHYQVRIENIATMAYQTALEFLPHLILLDVIMPDIEGPDVVNLIRSNEKLRDIPIVFLTATITRDEVMEQNGNVGGHEFLAKPTSVQDLINCLERQLQLHYN